VIAAKQRGFQQRHHIGVGSNENAGAVEAANRGVRAVQAELLLQPPHIEHTAFHQPFGRRAVGVMDLDRHLRAQRRSAPAHGLVRPRRSAAKEQGRSGGARGNGDHAPPGDILLEHRPILVSWS